jgi:drug/metabolite transporter (DMT)-like permease
VLEAHTWQASRAFLAYNPRVSKDPHISRSVFFAGLGLAVTGSILFSAKAIVVKLAYRYGVDPATLIALRMVFAAPFFVVAYVWSSRGKAVLTGGDHLRLFVIGFVGYYAASYMDFVGLLYVTAALERLILYLNPTLVLLLSAVFLGKRLTRIDGIALALAYGGIVTVFWHDVSFEGNDVGLGTALVFGSAASYAVYLVMSGELVKRLGAIRLTAYASLVATGAVVVQFLVLNPWSALALPAPVYSLSLVNGVFCTVLPVFATMMAVERVGAGNTSMAAMIGPVSTILLAWIFLGETVSAWQIAGTALVLSGIGVLSSKRPPPGVSGMSVPSEPAQKR